MSIAPGTRIGAYEVLTLIGSGGMGEVYRARDPRLRRDVAIKVLPDASATDPERRARLEREAQSIAALSHPNIVTIYSVEELGSVLCLTMEYVEGNPLSDLIAKGGLPVTQLLRLAIPLADAISAAHQKGITHRDLKPANVMIGTDGRVKVLDFGLAKLLDPSSVDMGITGLPTAPLTGEGRIIGTVAYMSPEQAEGKPVDARSDLFSLGVILYEMATGQRPFTGETSISLISSIVRDTPKSVTELNPTMPRELSRIVRRALAKDPELRYQTAKDLRNDLTDLQQEFSSGSLQATIASPPVRSNTWRWVAVGIAVAGAGFLAFGYGVWRWRAAPTAMEPRGVTFEQLTTQSGVKRHPSLSPDGKWVVYEGNQTGNVDIYLQSVGGQNPINLTRDSPDDDTEPAFSPDGESIAFRSEREHGGIFVMGRTGESLRRLTDAGYSPAWSPDGTRIVYATDEPTVLGRGRLSELWSVAVATGEKRRIFEGDAVQPNWSPHGLRIAYWKAFGVASQRDIATIPAAGGPAVPVTTDAAVDWNPVWSPDGRSLFFASDRGGSMNLWRVSIDERTGATLGQPEPLSAPSSSVGLMSVSADGRVIGYTSFTANRTIERVDFDPKTGLALGVPVTVVSGSREFEEPSASPDGNWVTFNNFAPQMEIFVGRADGTGIRQLTNDHRRNRFPKWSPDGNQIAFMSNRGGKTQIWSIKPDGSGLRRLTDSKTAVGLFAGWSPDGSKLLYHGTEPPDELKLFVIDPRVEWKDQTPIDIPTIIEPGVRFIESSWSPDSQQLVGTAARLTEDQGSLVLYSLATRRFTRLYDSNSTGNAFFLNDGRRLLFQEKSKLLLIDSQTRIVREVMSMGPGADKGGGAAVGLSWLTRDNRAIYFTRRTNQADIWLMRLK